MSTKIYLKLIVLFCAMQCTFIASLFAQPQHTSPDGTSNNIFPFNSTTNLVQSIYHAADFTPAVSAGFIYKIYYMVEPTYTTPGLKTYTNLQIRMGPTALNNTVNGPWMGGLTTVYFAASVTVNAQLNQWIEFALPTPYYWDGVTNLVVEASQQGYTPSGFYVVNNDQTGNRRMWGTVNSTSSSGAGAGLAYIGIDMDPPYCSGVPNSGITQSSAASVVCGSTVDLSLSGHTNMPGISYQWQRNTGSGWTNFGIDTHALTSPIITQNTQFRCQVTCDAVGGGTATSNAIFVTVTPIIVDLGNDTTICPGITQTLDATNVAGSTYLWTPGNLTTPTRNINTAGEYRVRVTQPNGCIGRDTIMITNGLQPVNNLAPSYNLCADSTITLDAGNSTGCYFLWTPTSATTQTLTINNGGNYSVLITSVDNCELVSATNVVYRPRPVLMLPPISTICSTDSVLLDATTPLGFTYSWSTGATTPSIYAKDSIFYYVTVSSEYGCPSWDDTKVEFYPDPTTEGFTFIPYFYEQLGKVTFAPINPQAVTSYRWYFGDGDSSYQRTPTHVYKGSGIYLVTLVVVNHCTENTYTQNVHINLPTGIVTTDANMEVAVYPNPAKDKVTIENKSNRQLTTVQIYNATGAIVYQENIKSNTHEIPLNSMASGIYQIRIQAEDNNWMIKKLEVLK